MRKVYGENYHGEMVDAGKNQWFGRKEWFLVCKARDLPNIIKHYAHDYSTVADLLKAKVH